MPAAGPAPRAMRRQWQDERGAEHGKQTTWQNSWNRNGQRRAERKQCLASVAPSVKCRRLRAAIGAQRQAQRAANTSIPSVLASAATPRCASMASADRQMTDDATLGVRCGRGQPESGALLRIELRDEAGLPREVAARGLLEIGRASC